MNNPLNLSRRDADEALTVARYRKLDDHPAWVYTVELFVQNSADKMVHIASFNCADEFELEQATEFCDYIIQGE